MPAGEVERTRDTRAIDAWVAEQLAEFAPLGPADLIVLAAILGYDAIVSSGDAA